MTIEVTTAVVYRATNAGRRYFTRSAAVHAEAVALIKAKYPTEPLEPDTGNHFHWSELPRSDVLLRRVTRLVAQSLRLQQ